MHGTPRYDCGDEGEGAVKSECGSLQWAGRRLNLRQFLIHTPSEHTLNGMTFAAELEMVYCDGECVLDLDRDGKIKAPDVAGRRRRRQLASEEPVEVAEKEDQWATVSVLFHTGLPSGGTNMSLELDRILGADSGWAGLTGRHSVQQSGLLHIRGMPGS